MASPFTATLPGIDDVSRASEAAIHYLRALMTEKAVSQGHAAEQAGINIDAWIARHNSKAQVSANIDRLKAEGFTGRNQGHLGGTTPSDLPEVPAGRYAVEITGSEVGNDLAFYKVDRPTEGRWAGYVFVNMITGPNETPVKGQAAKTILAKIAVDPAAASIRYGQKVEKCGVCHTRLTNKASREAGIGPDCRKKFGW